MDKQLVFLKGNSSSVSLEIDATGWCKCYLIADNTAYLGAEQIHHMVGRLLTIIDFPPSQEVMGKISGYEVIWVLSLAEANSTLYMAVDGEERLLFWQNGEATIISITKLSPAQSLQWKNQLEMLLFEINEGKVH